MRTKIRPGFFLQMHSGEVFYPKDGEISEIKIEDIRHALSHICRFNGHCRSFYSVAEHSVLVSRIIRHFWPDDLNAIWAGLLHDATEAYVGDVTTPLKVTMPEFMALEHKIEEAVAVKFQINWDQQTIDRVKFADMTALATEAAGLFPDVSHWESLKHFKAMPELQHAHFPLESVHARLEFTREFAKVSKERNHDRSKDCS